MTPERYFWTRDQKRTPLPADFVLVLRAVRADGRLPGKGPHDACGPYPSSRSGSYGSPRYGW